MHISMHWRLNAKRYRLEGTRYTTGELSFSGGVRRQENSSQQIGNDENPQDAPSSKVEGQHTTSLKGDEGVIAPANLVEYGVGARKEAAAG